LPRRRQAATASLDSTVYTKLSEKRARGRAHRALAEYEERQAAEKPQLYVVGE
jgi:hypothetical protein